MLTFVKRRENLEAGCRIAGGRRETGSWLFSWQDAGIIYFFVRETECKQAKARVGILCIGDEITIELTALVLSKQSSSFLSCFSFA